MRSITIAPALALLALAACGSASDVPVDLGIGPNPSLPQPKKTLFPTVNVAKAEGWPRGQMPTPAAGLKVNEFGGGLEHPRWLHVLPNGDVLVAESESPGTDKTGGGIKSAIQKMLMKKAGSGKKPSANRITLLRDADGDGVAEYKAPLVAGLYSPFGMAFANNELYIANADGVVAFPYTLGQTSIGGTSRNVTPLPSGYNHHWTKSMVASPDGRFLFVGVGSNSNIGENGMEMEKGRAAIWMIDAKSGAYRIFANGLRNPVGIAWNPWSKMLWTSVNERDEIGNDLVPDYMTSVQDGGFYGWPWSYYGQIVDKRLDPPRPDMVAKAIKPDYALGPHTASLGLTFSEGAALGPQYAQGAFVGQHGSWNRKPASGYKVIFVPFAGAQPSGKPVDILTGFRVGDVAYGRPVGVIVARDGSLLVADDVGNKVWRVSSATLQPRPLTPSPRRLLHNSHCEERSDAAIQRREAGLLRFARNDGVILLNFLIALIAGALSAFAFAPYSLWPLMPLAFAALCEMIARAPTLRRALLIGWGFSVGQFCIGLNWIATAFTFQAAMPPWLGWIAVVLLSFYLAFYPMLAAGLAWTYGRTRRLALVLALAGAWAVCEWLRGTMFTGFAWNPVGAVLVDTPWRETSATIGTYGLTLLVVLSGGMLWLAAKREWRAPLGIAAVLLLLLAIPSVDLAPQQSAKRLRIVQPNIGQADKWREGFDAIAAQRLASLSQRPFDPRRGPPQVIFWPEAAVTDPLDDERPAAAPFIAAERQRALRGTLPGATLVTGGLGLTSRDGATVGGATNSVFILDSAARLTGRYDKAHLVPYGEYLPMRPLLSAIGLSRLAPGDLDFADGPGPRSIALPGGGLMGLQICYEIIFSGQVVDRAHRPLFLFNPSNDAWFGAWGPPQHLAQARLRAAEEGLPVIRSTPTGISALVDARGRLLQSIPAATAGIIDADLPPPAPATLFAQAGNLIPLLLGFAFLLAAIALGRRPR